MPKIAFATLTLVMALAPTAFASHPHQAICVVTAAKPDGGIVELLLQTESAREYVRGDPNTDVYDFRYQARICDDDNDTAHCSTYESKTLTHEATDEVTLVGMKRKSAVLFQGRITASSIDGKLVHRDGSKTTFSAKLDKCIAQSWVKLVPEANSNVY